MRHRKFFRDVQHLLGTEAPLRHLDEDVRHRVLHDSLDGGHGLGHRAMTSQLEHVPLGGDAHDVHVHRELLMVGLVDVHDDPKLYRACGHDHFEVLELVSDLVVEVPHAKVAPVVEHDILRPTSGFLDLGRHVEEFFDRFGRHPSDYLDLGELVQGHLADCGGALSIFEDIHLRDAGDLENDSIRQHQWQHRVVATTAYNSMLKRL